MALFLARNCSMRALFATFVAIVVFVADAGSWKLMPSFSVNGFPLGVEVAKMLLDDTWVDLQVTSNSSDLQVTSIASAICKNTTDSASGSSGAQVGLAGSTSPMIVAGAGAAAPAPPLSGVTPQMAARSKQEPPAIETQAVALSLLLERSCARSGSRQCLRSAHIHPRELRPITVTFGDSHSSKLVHSPRELRPVTIKFSESHASKLVRNVPSSGKAPLIASLNPFGLTHA